MKTLLLLLPLLRPLLSSQRRLCQRSLRASQVLHQQCPQGQVPQQCPHGQNHQSPHGQFLMLLLFLQSPQLLRQSLQLFRPNPQHLCISLHAKGLSASPLPQVSQLVPQLHQVLQMAPHCSRQRPLLDEVLAQVLKRNKSLSKYRVKKTKLMMMNLQKSSETGKSGLLELKDQRCHCFWIPS